MRVVNDSWYFHWCQRTHERGPSSRFQPPRPSNDVPLCLFRKVLVVRRLSRVLASTSSDVEENCLTPQLSSAVVRLVPEVKLYAFSLRAMVTFTLFDQVSRACPWFSPLREAKVRFVLVLQSPPLPLPLKFRVCRCLQSVPSPWKYHHLWPRVEPIIGSAEALPILCVRYIRWEREREREIYRERERETEVTSPFSR